LLAVYGIVYAHNIIPHHHHLESAVNKDLVCCSDTNDQTLNHHVHSNNCGHTQSLTFVHHEHSENGHEACRFMVKPVVHNSFNIAFLYVPSFIEDLLSPQRETTTLKYQYFPQKLLESYNCGVPLRAPPVFS